MSFYTDMERALLEAIEIEKGNVPLVERENMPARTYYVAEDEQKLIDELIEIRKSENMSQAELAHMTGNTQQAISRFEKKTHSSSMKLFSSVVNALGYEIRLVKKGSGCVDMLN